jgi:hypothetical protein
MKKINRNIIYLIASFAWASFHIISTKGTIFGLVYSTEYLLINFFLIMLECLFFLWIVDWVIFKFGDLQK